MDYKLKNENGKVDVLLKTGKDFSRNVMSVSAAQHIIDTGKMVHSTVEGYPICVDDKWFFRGETVKHAVPVPVKSEDVPNEEVPQEEVAPKRKGGSKKA